MSVYSLPCGDTDYDTYKVTLESVAYEYTLRYNGYDDSFLCYWGASGSDPVVSFKLTTGRNLLTLYSYMTDIPKGWLFVLDTMSENGRITHDEFGQDSRFQLIYITSDDTDIS